MNSNIYNVLLFALLSLCIGCGGSSSGGSPRNASATDCIGDCVPLDPPLEEDLPPLVNILEINGAAVTGPWANAEANLYVLDPAAGDLKGKLIIRGSTDAKAKLQGIYLEEVVTNPISGLFLLEVLADNGTTNINTGQRPIIDAMYTVVSTTMINNEVWSYPTPVTTMGLSIAALELDADSDDARVLAKIRAAIARVAKPFEFGVVRWRMDFLLTPALVDRSGQNIILINRYRNVIEIMCVIIADLADMTDVGTQQIFDALTIDMVDGKWDGLEFGSQITSFAGIADLETYQEKLDIGIQPIRNTSKDDNPETDDPFTINEVEMLMVDEVRRLSNPRVYVFGLESGAISETPRGAIDVGVDFDGDRIPNDIDPDDDNDGVPDEDDALPLNFFESVDRDGDGVGDNSDRFPDDPSEALDFDGDGVGNNTDAFPFSRRETSDRDNDGVGDNADLFPDDPNEWADRDKDGIGDNRDFLPNDQFEHRDTDGDGVGDRYDAYPKNAKEWLDTDMDGIGDNADAFPFNLREHKDDDGDGIGNRADWDDNDATEWRDSDRDGVGDNADDLPYDKRYTIDADGDGVGAKDDIDDNDPSEQKDSDGDGVGDNADPFPRDASEWEDVDCDGKGDNSDFVIKGDCEVEN